MRFIIITFFLFFESLALGKPMHKSQGEILVCETKEKEQIAQLSIMDSGKAFLKIITLKNESKCALVIKKFSTAVHAQVPLMKIVLEEKECALPSELEKLMLKNIYFSLQNAGKGDNHSILQWNRYKQPEDCDIKKFNKEKLKKYQKLWDQGLWGK